METPISKIRQTELWIGGEHLPASGKYFDDLNPDDNSVYSRVASGTAEDMDKAVKTAHEAFKNNQHWLAADRERWLSKAAQLVERDRQDYIDILVDEVGSPLFKAQFEVNYCINGLRAAAGVPRTLKGEVIPSDMPGVFSMAVREPVGVVAGISPFNVPLLKVTKQGPCDNLEMQRYTCPRNLPPRWRCALPGHCMRRVFRRGCSTWSPAIHSISVMC
jgi:acyl-CoA reductase-like NAD-dependent aldehyde dehydrogenase